MVFSQGRKETILKKRLLEKAWKSGFSAYGSRQNLQKATKLSVKKVDAFLQGKNSYTKFFIPQRRSYPRLTTLAFDINDIWCMDVAYVDKIAMPNDGVKFFTSLCRCLVTLLESGTTEATDICCCERWSSCHVK